MQAAKSATGAALARARAARTQLVRDLQCFASFPTISAQPTSAMRHAATWLAMYLTRIGLHHAQVLPLGPRVPPLVYADWLHAPGKPTLLIYGHYDVQPADPVSEWHSSPFTPTVRGDRLYARGITDDKGQLFAHVAALAAFLHATGRLPVNVRVVVEGEEEVGSPNFGPFVARHAARLTADACVVSDTPMLGPDRPALTYSLRGGLSVEVDVQGQRDDLHSGLFGGAVYNPLQAASELVASLHDATGRVAISGFYDNILSVPESERTYMAAHGPTDAQILRSAGATAAWGEPGYTTYERTTIRPSVSVNGIQGGYQSEGSKAVIPARATIKLNLRLVPNQSPSKIHRALQAHIRRVQAHLTAAPGHSQLTRRASLAASGESRLTRTGSLGVPGQRQLTRTGSLAPPDNGGRAYRPTLMAWPSVPTAADHRPAGPRRPSSPIWNPTLPDRSDPHSSGRYPTPTWRGVGPPRSTVAPAWSPLATLGADPLSREQAPTSLTLGRRRSLTASSALRAEPSGGARRPTRYAGSGGRRLNPSSTQAPLSTRPPRSASSTRLQPPNSGHIAPANTPIRFSLRNAVGVNPVTVDRTNPAVSAAKAALRQVFGRPPVFIRNGGTIAAVADIQHRLHIPVVLMGFALPDARLHAPNENLHLPTFYRSIEAAIWFLSNFAHTKSRARR